MLAQMRDERLARQEEEDKPADPLETVEVEIAAVHALGFTVTFKTTAAKVEAVTGWLRRQGYRPSRDWERTPDGRPICPKHRVIMTPRDKQGDQWYSHNCGSRDRPIYCKGYPDKSSPGWDHD